MKILEIINNGSEEGTVVIKIIKKRSGIICNRCDKNLAEFLLEDDEGTFLMCRPCYRDWCFEEPPEWAKPGNFLTRKRVDQAVKTFKKQ